MKPHIVLKIVSLVCIFSVSSLAEKEVVHRVELKHPVDEERAAETYDVVQIIDEDGDPYEYRMHLVTDVCSDGLCEIVEVTLVWTAYGDYKRMELEGDHSLTKNDHDPFTKADYERLDGILKNFRSPLGIYPLNTFVDTPSKNGVDAISGATQRRVSRAVVPGAAYSTWVLWHWANGDIVRELQRLTEEAESDA